MAPTSRDLSDSAVFILEGEDKSVPTLSPPMIGQDLSGYHWSSWRG